MPRPERALVVNTLVLTGLRVNELRTLTVGQLDLTPGGEFLQLDAADEKSREGTWSPSGPTSRAWLGESLKVPADSLFAVPGRVPPHPRPRPASG